MNDAEQWVKSEWWDGRGAFACNQLGPAQERQARNLGYPDAWGMNREHDWLHHLLAVRLGWPWSPTLRAVSLGVVWKYAREEEARVMQWHRWLNAPEAEVPADEAFARVPLRQVRRELLAEMRGGEW